MDHDEAVLHAAADKHPCRRDGRLVGRHGTWSRRPAQALRDAEVTVPLQDFGIPHRFLGHGQRQQLLDETGLRAAHVSAKVAARTARMFAGTATP